jgi:hypothetical protein
VVLCPKIFFSVSFSFSIISVSVVFLISIADILLGLIGDEEIVCGVDDAFAFELMNIKKIKVDKIELNRDLLLTRFFR